MMKLISLVDSLQRRARRELFSARTLCWLIVLPRACDKTNTLRMQTCQLLSSPRNSLFGIQIVVNAVPVPSACTPLQSWCGWLAGLKVCSSEGEGFPQRALNARATMQHAFIHCMSEPGQTRVPCIGIPVTQKVWEYATVKQRSAIQLPKNALSQKRQCCFSRSVLNQPKYYYRARPIIW